MNRRYHQNYSSSHSATSAFAQRINQVTNNEADSVRKERTNKILRLATAPLIVALVVAIAAAIILIVWSPVFVETKQGNINLIKVGLWSTAVGIGVFTIPIGIHYIETRKKSK